MVNIGEVVSGVESVASGSTMTIQPTAGEEWQINNIYYPANVTLAFTDGSNDIDFEVVTTGAGAHLKYAFNLTNTYYMKVKNNAGSTQYLAYDGRRTK